MTTPPRKHPAQRMTGATWLAWACAAVLGLSSLPVGAHIELKASFVALAVGNTAYEHIGSDSSGENDAEAVAAPPAGEQFRDCADCPEMVVIPAGRFEMGCDAEHCFNEKPVHEVQIRDDFALGRYEVTVGEFRRFVEANGYRSDAEQDAGRGCWEVLMGRESGWTPGRSWRNLEYAAEDREPVTCVSWNDAQAYAAWLGERTGAGYRLPSEAEWEYAAGPGTGTEYQFENDRETLCRFSNLAEPTKLLPNTLLGCLYGVPYPAAVGKLSAERVRPVRHARKRLGMGGGLLEPELRRGADGWERVAVGRLRAACRPRRLMELPSEAPPWREPLRGQRPLPFHRQRIPRGPDARSPSRRFRHAPRATMISVQLQPGTAKIRP